MNRNLKLAVGGAVAGILALSACSVDDDHDDRRHCSTSTQYVPLYFFSGVYYYDAGHHKRVPDHKLPQSAKKVPGFKPAPKTVKPPVNKAPKTDGSSSGSKPAPKAPAAKPAPAPKAPAAPAPAPRVGGRR